MSNKRAPDPVDVFKITGERARIQGRLIVHADAIESLGRQVKDLRATLILVMVSLAGMILWSYIHELRSDGC